MSNKPHYAVEGRDPELKAVVVSFMPNGASDPDSANNRGNALYLVTHAATGKWEVTLDDIYPNVIGITVDIQRATPAAAPVDMGITANTVETDGKFTVNYRETNASADIAANTNTRITATVWVTNRARRG